LAASSANVASVLTEDLASFLLLPEQGKVQIVVKEMMSKDVVQAVRDGEASLGVIWDSTETSGLQHVDYWNDQIAVVMNRSHPLSEREQLHLADIDHFDIVIMRHTQHTEAVLTRTRVISDVQRAFRLQVPTWEAGLRAAAQGVGVFVCSARLARLYAEPWKLHVKPLADEWNHQINKIIYPTGLVNPLAMQLVAHLSHQQRPAKTASISAECAIEKQ
jgi:DNA-binding transcriptional LysR family regulator